MKLKDNIIIIDSNFILLPFQFKIDYLYEIRTKIEGNLKFVIFQQIFDELEAKKRRKRETTKFSRLLESGKLYIEKNNSEYNIEIYDNRKEGHETTDTFLLKKANELKNETQRVFLATNDSDLRRRARKLGLNMIFLRQKRFLSIELS